MKKLLALLFLFSPAAFATALPVPEDCLPDGETEIDADTDLEGDGVPDGAEVVGSPRWYDEDPFTDDYLGEGDPLVIENKDGNLSGPNGEVANGGADGECIELYYKVLLKFKVTVKKCVSRGGTVGAGGSGTTTTTSECEETVIWRHRWYRFDKGERCPCC